MGEPQVTTYQDAMNKTSTQETPQAGCLDAGQSLGSVNIRIVRKWWNMVFVGLELQPYCFIMYIYISIYKVYIYMWYMYIIATPNKMQINKILHKIVA
jgi:hypothetical protein